MPEEHENPVDLLDGPPVEALEPTETPETPATPPPAFDPTALAKAFANEVRQVMPQQTQQQQPQMTPEEAARLLNVWNPDDGFLTEFDNLETRKAAFAKHRDALIRQADTLTQIRIRELQEALEKKYEPVLQQLEAYQGEQRQQRFAAQYPPLADKRLLPVVAAVAQQLRSQGKTFETEDELFTAIASGVEAVIKVSNPEFTLAKANTTTTNGNSIPTTTVGGGGGGGSKGEGAKTKSHALKFL